MRRESRGEGAGEGSETVAEERRGRGGTALDVLLLAAAVVLAYASTLHVPFQLDDPYQIAGVPAVRDLGLLFQSGVSPRVPVTRWVGYLTFALDHRVHGLDVAGYHVVNAALHLANALLLYALVRLTFRTPRLAGRGGPGTARAVALAAALLFALHPVQTEAVTYVVQRLAVLATTFCLLGLLAHARARLLPSGPARLAWYAAGLAALLLAMFTKENAFTFPAVVVLYDLLFLPPTPRRAAWLAPVLLTALAIPVTLVDLGQPLAVALDAAGAATRAQSAVSRWHYLLTELRVIVTYLRLLVFPVGQSIAHDQPVLREVLSAPVLLSAALLLALAGAAVAILVRDRRRPSALPLAAFGIAWFFATLAVESSVVPIADVIFEHRLYLPSAGFLLAVATVAEAATRSWRARSRAAALAAGAALAAAAVGLGLLTVARNAVWRSERSLWEDAARKAPGKADVFDHLGLACWHEGDGGQAAEAFRRAIALDPEFALPHGNLGVVLHAQGRLDEAMAEYGRAIALHPRYPVFLVNRALARMAQRDLPGAIKDYDQALALDPRSAAAHMGRGVALGMTGRLDQAVSELDVAIALDPTHARAWLNRGVARARAGDREGAAADLTAACRMGDAQGCTLREALGRLPAGAP